MAGVPAVAPSGKTWKLVFDEEFNGTAIDRSKWTDTSSAEADAGHGNLGNQQLEWNSFDNVSVANGVMTITAERENYTSAAGNKYGWTSGLITSSPSFNFQYGYIEERAKLPAEKGFWPAFWTWQKPGGNSWQETDVYEYYSDNHTKLYLSSHIGQGGSIIHTPSFDPSAGYHTYGADIQASGTTFYIDGVKVGTVPGSPTAPTDLISNLAVYSRIQPDASTNSAEKNVDYIRAYSYADSATAVTPQPGYDGAQPATPSPTPEPAPTPEPTPTPPSDTTGDRPTFYSQNFTGTYRNDTIIGNSQNNVIDGQYGNDTIKGGSGADKIIGNAGSDTMTGGAGNDRFDWNLYSQFGTGTPDRVTDFTIGDRLDVYDLDANLARYGNQAFSFIGTSAFSAPGQIRYITDATAGTTTIQGSNDGDTTPEFSILLSGVRTMAASDFVL